MNSGFAQEPLEAGATFGTHAEEMIIIRRAQKGDPEAVAELYNRHAPAIFRYIFLRMNNPTTAEDLTSEVFVKMVEALKYYSDRGIPFAAWLFRIAHDRVVDYYRGTARRPTVELSELVEDHAPGPEEQASNHLVSHYVVKALTALTDTHRSVIQLRFVEEYSVEDTARQMRKTTGAVKALQHRALRNLARQLKLGT